MPTFGINRFFYFVGRVGHVRIGYADMLHIGETGVGCHTGWLSHCQYLIRWRAVPCGDIHASCA